MLFDKNVKFTAIYKIVVKIRHRLEIDACSDKDVAIRVDKKLFTNEMQYENTKLYLKETTS